MQHYRLKSWAPTSTPTSAATLQGRGQPHSQDQAFHQLKCKSADLDRSALTWLPGISRSWAAMSAGIACAWSYHRGDHKVRKGTQHGWPTTNPQRTMLGWFLVFAASPVFPAPVHVATQRFACCLRLHIEKYRCAAPSRCSVYISISHSFSGFDSDARQPDSEGKYKWARGRRGWGVEDKGRLMVDEISGRARGQFCQ